MRKKFQNQSPLLQTAFPAGYQTQISFKKHPLHKYFLAVRCYSRLHFFTLLPVGRKTKQTHLKLLKHRDTLLAAIAIGLMLLSGIWAFLIELAEFGLQ